jgi:crossover junction endodeoxyribonuclease RuvC
MRVLGIDPGFGRMGWAVLEGNKAKQVLVECGCLETSPDDSLNVRLEEIYDHVSELIKKYKTDEAAVEDIFYFKNQKTVIGVGQARGVILLAIVKNKVKCFNYTPLQIKRAITGYGQADKRQMQFMVRSLLGLKTKVKSDDAADAIAVGLTHLYLNQDLRRNNV